MEMVKFEMDALRSAISDRRIHLRMTQDDVANAIGCTRKWVSRFERGIAGTTFDTVLAYARLVGIEILMDFGDETPNLLRSSRELRMSNDLSDVRKLD